MPPTLLNSCARATTAAEARFRIDYPEAAVRSSRIIALDDGAAAFVRRLAGQRWLGGHFLAFDHLTTVNGSGSTPDDAVLRGAAGAGVLLSAELEGADVVVMIAASAASAAPAASAEAASVIGDACALRSIMSAALVIDEATEPGAARDVVAALRPNAMVLVVLKSSNDIPEILRALRV
jgi:hypothetical protein